MGSHQRFLWLLIFRKSSGANLRSETWVRRCSSRGQPEAARTEDNGGPDGPAREPGTLAFTEQVTDNVQTALRAFTLRSGLAEQAQWAIDNVPSPLTFGGSSQLSQVFTPYMDGSLLSIGSAAGVDWRGAARGQYTLGSHLRGTWATALG